MDDSLYRVTRLDTRNNSRSVRYGTIRMVAGIVRDVKNANANRQRYSHRMDGYPYRPVELVIERVIVLSCQDVTAEFTKGNDDDSGDGGGVREPRGTDPHTPSPKGPGLPGSGANARAAGDSDRPGGHTGLVRLALGRADGTWDIREPARHSQVKAA